MYPSADIGIEYMSHFLAAGYREVEKRSFIWETFTHGRTRARSD
jgi:hypothetical protein